MATCKECALWNRDEAKDKAGRIQKNWPAKCLWESTEVYPKSIINFMGDRRPIAGYTRADNGQGCGRFIKYEGRK